MTEKNALAIVRLMGALCICLLFGIIYGPQHPQIFFWGTIVVCISIIAIGTSIKLRQFIKLAIFAVVLAFIGEKIDAFITNWLGSYNWLSFIANCILLAPFYVPIAMYFFRICTQDMENANKK